jgi:transposase
MKKISIEQTFRDDILKKQKLSIGMDLGDHWSCYCVLDEAGNIILEQKVAMTVIASDSVDRANVISRSVTFAAMNSPVTVAGGD